ncbi:hypothetical protein Poly21_19200 [Allorhodopirellula heiligendammensis]|uniref:Uncharacterized protein n=1 Tax=Allorhodopirellula heiligendammensis TaxID=2714739 RepID=A0A5C6C8R1_9BACT|nr:hypothetical protein Poly21_19200 [Allorhodopirellula heiligendammensis]
MQCMGGRELGISVYLDVFPLTSVISDIVALKQ